MAKLRLTLVAEGLKFPEGPVAMSDGSVVLTEMEGKRVLRVTPDGAIKVVAETDGGPNGLAVGPDNALYLTNNGASFQFFVRDGINVPGPTPAHHRGGSIQRIDLATGAIRALHPLRRAPIKLPFGSRRRTSQLGGSLAEGRQGPTASVRVPLRSCPKASPFSPAATMTR